MDRRKKIANLFFELKEDYFLQVVNNQLKNGKICLKSRFFSEFECLFGIEDTLPYFLDWVINNKKINIPENTTFVYRNRDWLHQTGLSWTEILLMEGVNPPLKWIYSNQKLIKNTSRISQ
jgi:hypothetical protein